MGEYAGTGTFGTAQFTAVHCIMLPWNIVQDYITRQKETERDRKRQKEIERDRKKQKETERNRKRQKEKERDRKRQKGQTEVYTYI